MTTAPEHGLHVARTSARVARMSNWLITVIAASIVASIGVLVATDRSGASGYALLFVALAAAVATQPSLSRLALPAVLLGVMPLACSLTAAHVGHVCTADGCVATCLPLCSGGGLIAGWFLGRAALRGCRPLVDFSVGAALVMTVGSIGCTCVGQSGSIGMLTALMGAAGLSWLASTRHGSR